MDTPGGVNDGGADTPDGRNEARAGIPRRPISTAYPVSAETRNVFIHVMTADEAWNALDERTRKNLNMSGEEFIRACQAGAIADPDQPNVMDVLMLMPVEW